MKKFLVEVKQVKTLYFELSEKNKRGAKEMITNLYNNVNLNDLHLEPFKFKRNDIVISRLRKNRVERN